MVKTKSLERLEQRMETIDKSSFRYQVLQSVKRFKTSWIELGQLLYTVWREKLYKEWGFVTFEAYTSKEIGIQKQTAVKLLKSYYFLEKEEPDFLSRSHSDSEEVVSLPSYEAVNALRLAKNKKELNENDYANLKREVFQKGKEAREIRRELTALIRQRQDLSPEEARRKKTESSLKRFLATLKSLKRDLEASKLVPASIIKDTEALIKKLERIM